jgi:hypothetical protein
MGKSETYEELTKRLLKEKEDIDRRLAKAKNANDEKERAIDRDRKILLGAYLLNKLKEEGERGPMRSMMNQDIPKYLTRDRDRELLIEFMGEWKPPVKEKKGAPESAGQGFSLPRGGGSTAP